MLIHELDIRIITETTGEHVRELSLNPRLANAASPDSISFSGALCFGLQGFCLPLRP